MLWPPDWLRSLTGTQNPEMVLPEALWGDHASDLQSLRIEPIVTEGELAGFYAIDDDFRLAGSVTLDRTRGWLQALTELRSRVLHG